jgi:tRNA threonylcarbamoyl adenosine modification protein YeaZ
MAMTLIAIDTAAPRLQLALLRPDGDVTTVIEDMPQGQAERIFPAMAELLGGAGVGYPDLTRIAVTTGPGSFTGMRIGLSAARGLSLALGIPAVGIPSLTALSLSASGAAAVLLDARRGEAYFQQFAAPGEPAGDLQLLPREEAEARLRPGEATLAGPFVDVAALARFAAALEPARWPPEPAYVRGADARPQERFRVERLAAT